MSKLVEHGIQVVISILLINLIMKEELFIMSKVKNDSTEVKIGMGYDEDVYQAIPTDRRVPWPTMMMIFIGMWVSLYSVAIGYSIGQQLSVTPAIWSCIIGYGIAGIFGALVGVIGVKEGLCSYILAKAPLSWYGQSIIALLMFIIIGFGSLGLQADAVGRSVGEVYPALGGSVRPVVSGLLCAIMMITAIKGVKWMGIISWITMPFFFVISIIATLIAVGRYPGGFSAILAIQNNQMTFSRAVFLNAGAWAGFVMLMADVSRFLKTKKEALTVIPIAFLIGAIPPICGVLLGATIKLPMEAMFVSLGIGFIGLVSIFGIAWTTNDNNAYTAGLAATTAIYPFKKVGRTKVTIVVAILGVIGAITGIGTLGVFQWIAAFHGSFNMSFVGVLLAHYFIVSRNGIVQTKGIAGIIAWLVSGLLTYFGLMPLPFLTAAALAFVVYLVLYNILEKPMFGESVVSQIEPVSFK